MTMSYPENILVVGLGLIGASFIQALKQAGASSRFLGSTRSPATLDMALKQGLIEEGNNDVAEASASLQAGDLVFIASPTLSVPAVLQSLKPALERGVIVTDAASVKGSVRDAARAFYGCVPPGLVLGHPIAGSEKSGLQAAQADLYRHHGVILTPEEDTDKAAIACVQSLWEATGATVSRMSVELHDQVLAATSHLPHVLAYSLVNTLAESHAHDEIFEHAAGGFRDFTRIAASDPLMWHDIVLANRSAILQQIDSFTSGLSTLREAIEKGDSESLLAIFSRAKKARDDFSDILAERKKK